MKGLFIGVFVVLLTVVSSVKSDSTIIDVKSEADLDQQLIDAGDKLVLLYFYAGAKWDKFPLKVIPILQELLDAHPENLAILKVDILTIPDGTLEDKYGVSGVPYLQLRRKLHHEGDLLGTEREDIIPPVESTLRDCCTRR